MGLGKWRINPTYSDRYGRAKKLIKRNEQSNIVDDYSPNIWMWENNACH
jgi:hypothetical protein